MDLSKLIKRIELDGITSIQGIKRLSPIANYEKWEPSFFVEYKDCRLKVRKVVSNLEWRTRADVVRMVNEIKPGTLPEIYFVGDNFVISEFVDGEILAGHNNGIDLSKVASTFHELHSVSETALRPHRYLFRKLRQKLRNRIKQNLDYIQKNNLTALGDLEKIGAILNEDPNITLGASHGDLSLHNLVKTKDCQYRIIDLESLRPFPIEYDFVKPLQDIFSGKDDIMVKEYGSHIDKYFRNNKYWILLYLTQKIVERDQMKRPSGIVRARELIGEII